MSSVQNDRSFYLGIDIGSVSLAYVVLDENRTIRQSDYLFHRGNIFSALEACLKKIDLAKRYQVAFNHKATDFFNQGTSVNEQVALIEGVKFLINDVGSISTIGGETFGLILFDEQGHYQKFISNSSCAAGTGAFLDQQAERLGLSGSAELSRLAESFSGEPPKIATRCAVFAKTDLIHCQQQGYSVAAIAAGLCKGLAQNITDTLVKGVQLRKPVVVVGGVAKNKKVIQYISEIIGQPVSIPDQAELAGAIGCALMAQQKQHSESSELSECSLLIDSLLKRQTHDKHYFFPPLKSEKSVFPNFEDHSHYISYNVEVDWYNLPQQSGLIPVFMGIDIGSTSTKAIVMDAQKDDQNILLGLYTRTMGQPIKATQALLRVLREIEAKNNIQLEFWGVGTTGSGRKFIHKILNADLVIDEITAHARAAYALNPQVDTIIEIGGQDSKFTVMKNGQVTFSVMNYVCAAGTGSFIEEQARRLDVGLTEYSALAVGTPSPLSSDRCTVFMERDLNYLMSQGYSKPELLAAVLHSVRDNYLSKVAHLNKIGNVICFQGATAKNHALVMAFEQKLQKPIFVSKYCHLTGALGVCLLLKEERECDAFMHRTEAATHKGVALQQQECDAFMHRTDSAIHKGIALPKSKFRGIDFYKESPSVINEICDGCKNHCKLTRIKIVDEDIVWGYLCGRDDTSDGYKPRPRSRFDLLSRRRKILNPADVLRHQSPDPTENILTALLDELKKINISISLDRLKQVDFEASLEKLKQLNLSLPLDKLKQLNLNIPLDKLKQLNLNIPLDKLRQTLSLNLLTLRHRIFAFTQDDIQLEKPKNEITIGLPNTLYLIEYAPFWELFFKKLGYSVKLSPARAEFMESGKEIAGAEFCAPIACWHGHVKSLSNSVDYLFLPHTFEGGDPNNPKFYCYYSNYAVSLVQNIERLNLNGRCLAPIIDLSKPAIHNVQQLYECLPLELKLIQTPGEILTAYTEAWQWFVEQKQQLVHIFHQHQNLFDDISVVLLGRPYLILDVVMNKNIPQKFSDLGVSTFFQDMLPLTNMSLPSPAEEFLEWNHWKFGENILKAAAYICQHGGLYPVILTAFKCSPDSFVINYFKEIMDAYHKPYLILQLDEHGSDVGYETRIEAAIRSFRNHYQHNTVAVQRTEPSNILLKHDKQGTMLIPNYDPLSCSLIAAAFEHAGYDALLIEETETSIQSSLRMNDGQCLPISAIAAAAVETISKHNLNPENTAIFLNAMSRTACNFPQYPLMTKKLLEQHDAGFEKVQVFATAFEMRGMPFELIYEVYCSYLLGGFLRKIGCKIRPYETIPGQTDQLIEASRQQLYHCIKNDESKEDIFRQIVAKLAAIPVSESYGRRPKVSIIGDLYVRDNDVFNQQLIRELENYGAEVVTTPITYVLRLQAFKHNVNLWEGKHYLAYLRDKLLTEVLEVFEKRFFQIANEIFQEEFPGFDDSIFSHLEKYNLSIQHRGETAQNVMKIFSLLHHYPDLKLFIHINPIFCCPGLVSESIFKKVEQDIGIPIVSIIYDGTATRRNEVLAPYLHYITQLDKTMIPAN